MVRDRHHFLMNPTAADSTPPPPPEPPPGADFQATAARQAKRDRDQLKILMVGHWVLTGLLVIGVGMLLLHAQLMSTMVENPEMWEPSEAGSSPEEVFEALRYLYWVLGSVFVLSAICNAISARCIRARQYRLFSLVVAGLNIPMFPFGTLLGAFTLMVLLRDSVVATFDLPPASDSETG
jgi:hypothetical protein